MKSWTIGLVGVLALTLSACHATVEEPAYTSTNYESLDAMDTASDTQSYEADPYASDPYAGGAAASTPTSVQEDVVVVETGPKVRTHTVAKGDTFYSLARKYYNDQAKWKKLWEANKAKVPDPDKLYIGTELVIP